MRKRTLSHAQRDPLWCLFRQWCHSRGPGTVEGEWSNSTGVCVQIIRGLGKTKFETPTVHLGDLPLAFATLGLKFIERHASVRITVGSH